MPSPTTAHTGHSTQADDWQEAPHVAAHQRRILKTLVIAQVIGGLGTGAGVSMGSIITYEVTGDESLAGVSRTVGAISIALMAAPMVALAIRKGRRISLATGWSLATCGALLQVIAVWQTSLALLLVGLLTFGAGQAATLQSRFAVTDLERPSHRARSLSLVVWATAVGTVIGPNLAAPGGALGRAIGLPPIGGAYLITAAASIIAAATIAVGLRPDPLITAQRHEERPTDDTPKPGFGQVLRRLLATPLPRAVLVAMVVNHTIMVTVMTLTPVHLLHTGHGLSIVGLTISFHTLGMFAFSPVVGWLADRWGGARTMAAGFAIHVAALATGALADDHLTGVMVGLFLLGLGWSLVHVAGSAHLNDVVEPALRRPAQGVLDTCTNIGAAIGAGSAGGVLAAVGFAGLNLASAVLIVPVAVAALAARRSPQAASGS